MADITIYATMLCPFCYRAKALFKEKGVEFEEIDVTFSPRERSKMIERAGGRTSVPQIFIAGRHVGGCDELYALEAQGRLDGMLAPA